MAIELADFAAGCFWGVEAMFRKTPGVIDAVSGYEGGTLKDPTYRAVCTGRTGHAETVQVKFDSDKVSFQQLMEIFFENHDPTTRDRQGPDYGSQYRSVIFYHSPQQEEAARADIQKRNDSGEYVGPIVTQVEPAERFYPAEEYHQRYFEKQGVEYSCHLGNGKKRGSVHA